MDHHHHQSYPTAHVLILPLPLQGHVTPMLHLAELFCLANLKVTFLNTTQIHQQLTQHTNIEARFAHHPGFRFKTIPLCLPNDGLQQQGGKSSLKDKMKELTDALALSARPFLKELFGSTEAAKITCFVIDGWLNFAHDIANEAEVPTIIFKTSSACCNWACFCVPQLIDAGEVPFKDNEEMDQLVRNLPGMEGFLRCRDLPTFCRGQDMSSCHDLKQFFIDEIQKIKHAQALILNTFNDLEGPIVTLLQSQLSRVYPIGPLHAHLKYRLNKEDIPLSHNSSSSLWEVDRSCISWLDQKPNKSVVFVSFGSSVILTRDQLMEFWAGLVQSNKYFLWVIRPELITGNDPDNPTPDDLLEGTKKRGCMVKWAPQDEVLAHRAIGGFLTHSGWNSTLESIMAGVPMLCWPHRADQQMNSRYVSEVWRIGLDMKDTCDRTIVEKMTNDLMEGKKDELQRSMDITSHLAKKSITEGGSSYSTLNHLIEDIKSMSKKRKI